MAENFFLESDPHAEFIKKYSRADFHRALAIAGSGAQAHNNSCNKLELLPDTMSVKDFLMRYKPGVSIRTHLLLGALIWTVVGFFLLTNGFVLVSLVNQLWYGVVGIVLGIVKAFFVLDRVARKNIKRIRDFEDKVCFGSVYSLKTWFLVAAMIGLGRFLRTTVLPGEVIGMIYMAVGLALMLSSRLMWVEWTRTSI